MAFAASRRDARPRPQLIDESGPPRLFTNPPASSPTPNEVLALVDAALQELQPRLARLIGADGYDALLERAVHRAAARQAILPTAGGGHVDRVRGALAVIAELIVLLVDFLGQDLTRRVALGNCRWSALLDGTGDDPEPHT